MNFKINGHLIEMEEADVLRIVGQFLNEQPQPQPRRRRRVFNRYLRVTKNRPQYMVYDDAGLHIGPNGEPPIEVLTKEGFILKKGQELRSLGIYINTLVCDGDFPDEEMLNLVHRFAPWSACGKSLEQFRSHKHNQTERYLKEAEKLTLLPEDHPDHRQPISEVKRIA